MPMTLFTSSREKNLWSCALVVLLAIYSTLFLGRPLATLFQNQNLQAAIFLFVMILIGTTIILHAFNTKPTKIELTIWIGVIAAYIMFFLRLGLPERSHLIEYGVLAIFIHLAISERVSQGKLISTPALIAFLIAFLIGVVDECIQICLPHRIFDPIDIMFNGIAAALAIGSRILILWIRRIKSKG